MPLASPNNVTGDGDRNPDQRTGPLLNLTEDFVVGWWWSESDFQWWPAYLGEIWEASGNTSIDVPTARKWWEVNYGGKLRSAKPFNENEVISSQFRYDGSGRQQPSGGGGGRGGAGAAPPVYRAPDEASVREQIKMYVVATTGAANQSLIDRAVDAYMNSDREAFDRNVADSGDQVDPFNNVKDIVRGSAEYKQIHTQRPESVDELDWVTSRQGKLRSLGLSAERAESLGIKQATVGANDEALTGAAEMQFNADTGRMLASQRDKLKRAGSAAMGLL